MASNILISVVVPVYNVKRYLRQCLDTLSAQTFKECEFILVDDCSTDLSGIICDIYAHNDSRFKVIHLDKNSGTLKARIEGIQVTTGKYCMFFDGDDYLPFCNVLDRLYTLSEKYNVDILQYDVNIDCDVEEKEKILLII